MKGEFMSLKTTQKLAYNDKINELHNTIDAKDKIINEQALEIARLNKDLKDACYVIEKIKKEKEELLKKSYSDDVRITKAIEYLKAFHFIDGIRVLDVKEYEQLLEILEVKNE